MVPPTILVMTHKKGLNVRQKQSDWESLCQRSVTLGHSQACYGLIPGLSIATALPRRGRHNYFSQMSQLKMICQPQMLGVAQNRANIKARTKQMNCPTSPLVPSTHIPDGFWPTLTPEGKLGSGCNTCQEGV